MNRHCCGRLCCNTGGDVNSVTVRVPLIVCHRPGGRTVVTLGGTAVDAAIHTRSYPAMVKALARAFRWQRMLEDGRYASISEIATADKIDHGYVGSTLRQTLLAPAIIEAILDGRQSSRWHRCSSLSRSSGIANERNCNQEQTAGDIVCR
jgi:hypothetical protein